MTDADGNVFGDSFTVTQSADEARITLADDVAPIEGGRRAVAFSTNLGALLAEMKVEVTYADPAVADFISDVELGAGELTYAITANEGVEKRYATITVSCADLAGGVVSASSNITQRVTAQPREVSSADLRALFTAEDKSYASDEDHIDYLLCRVIGDAGNPNMDQNLNTGPNSHHRQRTTLRTTLPPSLDSRTGFRLKFAPGKQRLPARGAGEDSARRRDPFARKRPDALHAALKAGNIEKAAEASALEPKARTIATLTDDDIYTYCALSGLEFSVKEGAYTNVREYDAIGNPCNANLSFAGGTQAQKAKDGAANLLYDGDNDAIYMLVNMNCGWRRTGRSVPQGVGTVSGIVVHTPMERWGGNVGRYSIRPFDEADIDIPRAAASAYATLVEWRLDKAVISVGAYKWNDNGTYTVGSAANSATQLVQNRMHYDQQHGRQAQLWQRTMLQSDGYRRPFVPHRHRSRLPRTERLELRAGRRHDDGHVEIHDAGFPRQRCRLVQWNGDTWTGKTNGIVMEFSTAGVGGSAAAVSFSTAAGKLLASSTYRGPAQLATVTGRWSTPPRPTGRRGATTPKLSTPPPGSAVSRCVRCRGASTTARRARRSSTRPTGRASTPSPTSVSVWCPTASCCPPRCSARRRCGCASALRPTSSRRGIPASTAMLWARRTATCA